MKLSKRDQTLLDDFDDAARTWGWESDQGTGSRVANAQAAHAWLYKKMQRRLARPVVKKDKPQPNSTP